MRRLMKTAILLVGVMVAFGLLWGCGHPRMPIRLRTPTWIQGTWISEVGSQQLVFTDQDLIFQTGDRSYQVSEAFSSVKDNGTVVDYYTITGVPAFPLSLIRSGTVTLTFHRINANLIEVENPLGPSGRFIRQTASPSGAVQILR